MNIYGEKILLRAIETSDEVLLREMVNDPQTEHMIGGSSFPVSELGQRKWIEQQSGRNDILRCIVTEIDDPTRGLGTVILSDIDNKNGVAQVHIKLAVEGARGKGYGTDAMRTIVKYAFQEMRLNCIYAEVLAYNQASKKLFEKCGFICEGVHRARVYKSGRYIDVLSYSILKADVYGV